tara:strand:+ start:3427 stop:3678 length:252 start_codon:yes stop_codon:yes gene_type:complete
MFSIQYFASVREQLGSAGETLEASGQIHTVADLTAMLAARGGAWTVLEDRHAVLVAVDQTVADRNRALTGHEEVAFFPPMTGG